MTDSEVERAVIAAIDRGLLLLERGFDVWAAYSVSKAMLPEDLGDGYENAARKIADALNI